MKEYNQFIPASLRVVVLLLVGLMPFAAKGQGVEDARWYFGGSPEWISFLQGAAAIDQGQLPLGVGGSVVATDYQTGDLLFYAGGSQLVNPTATPNTLPLNGNASLPQPVHAVPAPGIANTYFLFVITLSGELVYHTYNYTTHVLSAATPINLGGANPAGTMELIRGASPAGYVYWLVIPLAPANGVTSVSIIRIAPAAGSTPVPTTFSLGDLPYPITVRSMAYSEEKGLLALGGASSTDPVPVMLYSFDNDPTSGGDLNRLAVADTITTLTAQNGDISGLAWKGDYLLAAKQQNAQGTSGNIYRVEVDEDFDDIAIAEPVPGSSFFLNLDLKTAPDGRVYHLYRAQAGGPALAGYVRNAGTRNPSFVPDAFGGIDFAGNYFNQAAPPPQQTYTVAFDYVNACSGAITYFYPKFTDEAPERVEWRKGNASGEIFSTEIQPVVVPDQNNPLFTQTGPQPITLIAYYANGVTQSTQIVNVTQGYTMEVQQEIILCPGDTKTIGADQNADFPITIQDANGQDVDLASTGLTLTWFKPRSVKKTGKNTPETANQITVDAVDIPSPTTGDPIYPEAGTYYVVLNDPANPGCQIYASFVVRIYNYEFNKMNIWYFGDGAELDFSAGQPVPQTEYPNPMVGPTAAPEGVSLAVDPNVDPLFSTNGNQLWVQDYNPAPAGDGTDDLAPNGNDIGGTKDVTQNSLFEQFLQDPSLYYLFTIGQDVSIPSINQRSLRYTVTDLKGNPVTPPTPPSSDVELASSDYVKGRLLKENVAEKLISVEGDSSRIWVITHGIGNNLFYSFPITAEGIGAPITSSAGSVYTETEAPGYLMASSSGELLAAAVGNAIEVYRFNKATGEVFPDGTVRLTSPDPVYGISFSPSDERLFFTAGTKLYQTSLDSALTQDYLQRSLIEVFNDNVQLGAIQLAPNNQLYVARNGQTQLGLIANPEDSITSANAGTAYNPNGLQSPLNGTSLLGLPNLRRQTGDAAQDPIVSAMSVCEGETVVAKGTPRYSNEQFVFILEKFENNSWTEISRSQLQQADSIEYPGLAVGRYRVTLELEACDLRYPTDPIYADKDPVTTEFFVNPIPVLSITNVDPTFCEDQALTLNGQLLVNGQQANVNDYIFVWTNSARVVIGTSLNQQVTEQGLYTLTAISRNPATACPIDPVTIAVGDRRPNVELGDDLDVCAGETLPAQITATITGTAEIEWLRSVNGGQYVNLNNNTVSQSLSDINTSQAGVYSYLIRVRPTDVTTNCFRADTLTISIALAPTVTLRPTGNNCAGSTVLVANVANGSGTYAYEFFREGVSIGPGVNGQITVTTSGNYSVSVTDLTSTCPANSPSVAIDVQNGIQDVIIETDPGCRTSEGETGLNELTATHSYVGAVTYTWERNVNGNWQTVGNNQASQYFPDGTYRVTAKATAGGCAGNEAVSPEIVVVSVLSPRLVIQPFYTICRTSDIPEQRSFTITLDPSYQIEGWFRRVNGQTESTPISRLNTFEANTPGEYALKVEGCQDPAFFKVVEDCTPVIVLPNAIRINSNQPNNRDFKILNESLIINIDEQNFEILIFNRWGEVIKRYTDPNFVWDGTGQNGKAVPMGNYPYVVYYKSKYGDNPPVEKLYGSVFVMY